MAAYIGIIDCIVFGGFLTISISVGIFYAIKTKRQRQREGENYNSTNDFLMGSRQMPMLPIMLSVVATFLSGILLLGAPADIYQKG
jgi:Na+/proline symporter